MQFWTLKEFTEFERAISGNVFSHAIFSMLFWSGMRSGELLTLEPEDFNFDKQTIRISKNYARLNGKNLLLPPKTPKSNRQIVLPLAVCVNLRRYIETLQKESRPQRLFPVTKRSLTQEMNRGIEISRVSVSGSHTQRYIQTNQLGNIFCTLSK